MFLLKSSSTDLRYALPSSLTVSLNHAQLNQQADDVEDALHKRSLWMLMLGFAGSFGCDKNSYTEFSDKDWNMIFDNQQIFNVDLFYTRTDEGTLDVDLTLDAEGLFSSRWSSNLGSGVEGQRVSIDDLVVEKLYYYYLDNGFNQARNNVCKRNYQGSYSDYQQAAVENIQKHLRIHTEKELSELMLDKYKKLLNAEVEYNTIISLKNRDYLSQIYQMKQEDFLANSFVELAVNSNDYLPITLKEIDYEKLGEEVQLEEQRQRDELAHKIQQKIKKEQNKKILPKIYTTGKKSSRKIAVSSITNYLNRKVRIKTDRGRPVTGYITDVQGDMITIETKFKTGKASMQIKIKRIASAQLMR